MLARKQQSGFTLIELLIVIVIIGILGTLVVTTYSGIQQKMRNSKRQTDINALQGQLEAYFAQQGNYPTLADMQNRSWIKDNLKNLDPASLQDPNWSLADGCKDKNNAAILNGKIVADCYAYQATDDSGNSCNDGSIDCTKYTLTATYEGGGTYVKSSLN